MKRQAPKWEQISAKNTTDKEFTALTTQVIKTQLNPKKEPKTRVDIFPKKLHGRPLGTWKGVQQPSSSDKRKLKPQWDNPSLTRVSMATTKQATNTNAGEDVEKREPLHMCWECTLGQPLWKTARGFLRQLQAELPYDPEIPGYIPGKKKIHEFEKINPSPQRNHIRSLTRWATTGTPRWGFLTTHLIFFIDAGLFGIFALLK